MDFQAMLRAERAAALRRGAADAALPTAATASTAAAAAAATATAAAAQVVKVDLAKHRVHDLPDEVYYLPEFVGREEASALVAEVTARPFVQLAGRQLQNYGGVPHPTGTILEPLPTFLAELARRLALQDVFPEPPDQALVNRYACGEGIAAHQDGEIFAPRAAVLSLQSSATLAFEDLDGAPLGTLLLEPRSLVLFTGSAYERCKHSVPAQSEDAPARCANAAMLGDRALAAAVSAPRAAGRISVTLRCVRQVLQRVDPASEYVDPQLAEEMQRRERWWRTAISQ